MNLFNSFQAMAFYTIMPFGIQYLFEHNHSGWGFVLSAAQFVAFCLVSFAVNKSLD